MSFHFIGRYEVAIGDRIPAQIGPALAGACSAQVLALKIRAKLTNHIIEPGRFDHAKASVISGKDENGADVLGHVGDRL